ncbi:hypothetical protein ACF09E_11680 [Streptomyces sp. NPDC014891]|uniref:hypothetical protein n=1 Tax=Streptomyces sp. NPDC014891 TaxID=3364929 RepID=UPI0036F75316
MTPPTTLAADPIEAHVAALAAALHGPARVKSRLLHELREGLVDAARDLSEERPHGRAEGPREAGERAARQAVREFGSVAELAPGFQQELTVAQARHTARTVLLVAPLLLGCWYLVSAWNGSSGHRPPGAVEVLVAHLSGLAAAAALVGAAALLATGALARRLPAPDRLPLVVAWTGTATAAALAVSALTLAFASALAASWPLCVAAGATVIALHARVAASARACRTCARLPGA